MSIVRRTARRRRGVAFPGLIDDVASSCSSTASRAAPRSRAGVGFEHRGATGKRTTAVRTPPDDADRMCNQSRRGQGRPNNGRTGGIGTENAPSAGRFGRAYCAAAGGVPGDETSLLPAAWLTVLRAAHR